MNSRHKQQVIYKHLLHKGGAETQRFLVQYPVASRFMIRRLVSQMERTGDADKSVRSVQHQVEQCVETESEYLGMGPIAVAILIAIMTEVVKAIGRYILDNWGNEDAA